MASARLRSLPPAGAPGAADPLPAEEACGEGLASDPAGAGEQPTRDPTRSVTAIEARRNAGTAVLRLVEE